jgi:retron-type reverse transcriptase
MVKFMWTLYNNPKTKHHIFDNSNINQIKKLLTDYNYIQSLLVIKNLQRLKTRITQRNIPHEIEILQCLFLESFPISIVAVYEVSKSLGANMPGIDKNFFKTLKNKKDEFRKKMLKGTRYQKSGKTLKVKKDLPLRAVVTDEVLKQLKSEFLEETLKRSFKLLQQCNLKTLQKNYKKSHIWRVWIPKKTLGDFRLLGIPTLKDRVLQQIVAWGIQPISESQADSLSFSFRPQRSATQAIAYTYRKLCKSRITRNRLRFKPVKVGKERFDSFSGKKAKFKSSRVYGNKKEKRNRRYNYSYWIYLEKTSKFALFKFYSQYYYLNVDIVKCFDQMSHQVIFEKVPLANKYLYLMKCWTTRLIIGPETKESKDVQFKLTKGISQHSIIEPMICNIVLDGLQDFIQDHLPSRYKKSREELEYMEYKLGKTPSSSKSHTYLQVFCIRYADNILILGKCLKLHVKKIQNLLVKFLSQRGLGIKNASIFQGKRFKPGMSFDFLGFTFKYPNLDSASFDKGKYSKLEFTPMSVAGETSSRYSRSGPYLLVKRSSLKKLKNFLRVQLSIKNGYLSVKTMIDKVNIILKNFLNYYNLTVTTKKQLLPINNLLHKLFYKYLLRKFSSVPQIYRFIKTNFIDQNRFKDENKVLLKVNDINPLESVTLVFIAPLNKLLVTNTYR